MKMNVYLFNPAEVSDKHRLKRLEELMKETIQTKRAIHQPAISDPAEESAAML